MVGFDFYEFVHRKDITMVKNQLSTTASESKEEKTIPKNSSILKEGIEISGNLCPGAKRSFLCRMKKGAKADDIMSMGTKTSITKTKGNVMVDETDPVLISYEGYLKSWPPNKEIKSSKDPNSRSCLVAIGRILEIGTEQTDYSKLGQICEFETRQRADSTIVRVDQSFTKILGYCSDEVYGKSAYSFLHKDDLKILAEAHYKDLNNKSRSTPEIIYRFRAKAGHYVPLKSTSVTFRNPWSKEVDYVVTRSVVISSFSPIMSFSAMQRGTENMDIITQTTTSAGSSEQQDEMDENLRNLLLKLENLGNNEGTYFLV
ncbi:Aryl hydrocarbon receptor nuclear translocator 1 [Paramuricea clavata]|uniref:Aryl hydrocarbon receptor nuclear translocator 1 n=1 Tax=Paramuricea clavata TaxID=317549 RepID=A0A6S7JXD3_PARCT|nr:Aryl hydrocarbon receptor nuclear translocator 1 [Paramuricea clavata]